MAFKDDDAKPEKIFSSFLDGVYSITKFDGDDDTYSSVKWAQDIEDNAAIFSWTPQQKLIIARRSLTGTAELWLKTEKVFKTFEELKTALQSEFPEQINSKEMHELMAARKKKPKETYYQYMLVMKEMGKRAKFPDYVSIQYIIEGILDDEMNKSILYGAKTYPVLKEKLTMYEKMKEKAMGAAKESSERNKRQGVIRQQHQSGAKSSRCYSCGDHGHISSACPNGVKCFKCNQFGHLGKQCSKMETVTPARRDIGASSSGMTAGSARFVKQPQQGASSANRMPGKPFDQSGARSNAAMFGTSTAATNDKTQCECQEKNLQYGDVYQIVNNNKNEYQRKTMKKPMKMLEICGVNIKALLDTGSCANLVSDEQFSAFGIDKYDDNLVISGLGQTKVKSSGQFSTSVTVDGELYEDVNFHVVPRDSMPFKLILGQEFLNEVVVVLSEGDARLFPREDEWWKRVNCFANEIEVTGSTVSSSVREQVEQLVSQYQPHQTKEAPIQLKIVLKDDVPVTQRPRRLALTEQKIVEDQVNEWIENGIAQVSFSEYASPLVLVKKKDGSTRLCVDYRLLNKKIIKDVYPLPIIEDVIDKLKSAKVFSILDLKNGFFHLKVSEESIPYTSFVTHHGQFEFLRAPFGLTSSPKCFMRFVTIIFRELIAKNIMMIFIDDIIIPAESEAKAVDHLKQVLEVAAEYGLEINWKKAKLISPEIEYLGHCIKDGEVRPSKEKIDAVVRFPEPKTTKQVMSFIGLTSYFRKYIKDYAKIAKPLTDLLRKDRKFNFNEEQRRCFEELKQKLVTDPVLKIYDPKLPTELHTDASSQALAAILLQRHPDGDLHPVHYMSHKTSDTESRCSSYELEALAVVQGVKKFRQYLYGVHFKIVTDCKAFELTLRKKDLTPKVARWALLLDEYDFEIEHRAGTKMKHADALSRNPFVGVIGSLHDEIRYNQETDEELNAIRSIILKEGSYNDYWIDSGIIYKGVQKQIVVPRTLEKEILKRIHENGHFSAKKMKEAVNKDYFIRNLDNRIKEVVSSCISCLLAKRKSGKAEGFLNSIDKDGTPLHTLHLDHIGPLTQTKKQYNHILTCVDGFTKFVWLFPTKSTSTAEVLNKLAVHQQIFGNPTRIITDRGTAFTSNDFEKYCKEENIEHIKITTGVPRGNGQVERIHRTLIPMFTKLCQDDQSVWYKHVSKVQRALNNTYQRSINTSPFELMTGTKMKTKEDIEIIELLQQEVIEEYNEQREEMRRKAKEQIQKVQEENKKTYDRKRKESNKYELDELVAIKRTQFGPALKLKNKFYGPYKVVKIKRNDRYDVEKVYDTTEGPQKTSTSADLMKKWPEEEA